MVTTNAPDGKFKLKPLKEKSDDVLEAGLSGPADEKIAFFQTTVLDKMPAVEWILDSFREGNRAILIDIRPIRSKKGEDLRRAVDRLKLQVEKTGKIMQLDENWLLLIPEGIKLLS